MIFFYFFSRPFMFFCCVGRSIYDCGRAEDLRRPNRRNARANNNNNNTRRAGIVWIGRPSQAAVGIDNKPRRRAHKETAISPVKILFLSYLSFIMSCWNSINSPINSFSGLWFQKRWILYFIFAVLFLLFHICTVGKLELVFFFSFFV